MSGLNDYMTMHSLEIRVDILDFLIMVDPDTLSIKIIAIQEIIQILWAQRHRYL